MNPLGCCSDVSSISALNDPCFTPFRTNYSTHSTPVSPPTKSDEQKTKIVYRIRAPHNRIQRDGLPCETKQKPSSECTAHCSVLTLWLFHSSRATRQYIRAYTDNCVLVDALSLWCCHTLARYDDLAELCLVGLCTHQSVSQSSSRVT